MKIRHPWVLKLAGLVASVGLRLWMGTVSYRYRSVGLAGEPGQFGRYLYVFWHETLLYPVYRYSRPGVYALISRHADGQLVAEVCRHLRLASVRGSTHRGSVPAVRQLLRLGGDVNLAITPDGPQGPRRRVQQGAVYLAAQSGLAIVPVGVGFDQPWRIRSWDRFAIPRPWSRAACVAGEPLAVPAGAGREELETYRLRVEDALLRVTELAERWAETGRWPGVGEWDRHADGSGHGPNVVGRVDLALEEGGRYRARSFATD